MFAALLILFVLGKFSEYIDINDNKLGYMMMYTIHVSSHVQQLLAESHSVCMCIHVVLFV